MRLASLPGALLLTAVAALFAADAAGAAPCTAGQNCYCDRVQNPQDALYDPNVLFCEDFEDPSLNFSRGPQGGDKGDSGWFQKYGGQTNECWSAAQGSRNVEGAEGFKCVNVVQPGACDSPDGDCVFDGNNALGLKFRPGRYGGLLGDARFSRASRTIGYTYVYKYSSNFVNRGGPIKTNEFGNGLHCLLGCNTNNIWGNAPMSPNPPPAMSSWMPRAMSIGVPDGNCAGGSCFGTVLRGVQGSNNTFHLSPLASDYSESDHPIGSWGCRSFHIDGWGTSNARIRVWHNDRLLIHVEGANLTGLRDGTGPLDRFVFNNYHNNTYQGPSTAYIYQDNIHATSGSEPASCAAMGFGGATPPPASPPPGDGPLSAPGRPFLITN